eukprot:IDg8960t1
MLHWRAEKYNLDVTKLAVPRSIKERRAVARARVERAKLDAVMRGSRESDFLVGGAQSEIIAEMNACRGQKRTGSNRIKTVSAPSSVLESTTAAHSLDRAVHMTCGGCRRQFYSYAAASTARCPGLETPIYRLARRLETASTRLLILLISTPRLVLVESPGPLGSIMPVPSADGNGPIVPVVPNTGDDKSTLPVLNDDDNDSIVSVS